MMDSVGEICNTLLHFLQHSMVLFSGEVGDFNARCTLSKLFCKDVTTLTRGAFGRSS